MILIETARLQMRKFELQDAEAVLAFSRDPQVTRYTGDKGEVKTLDDAKRVIEQVWFKDYRTYGYGRYALVHKADNKVIGFCGLKYLPEFEMADLGYRMLPDYWGQGLGMECAQAALCYGFDKLELDKVFAMADVENTGSNRILQKLGFIDLGESDYHGHRVITYEKHQG